MPFIEYQTDYQTHQTINDFILDFEQTKQIKTLVNRHLCAVIENLFLVSLDTCLIGFELKIMIIMKRLRRRALKHQQFYVKLIKGVLKYDSIELN